MTPGRLRSYVSPTIVPVVVSVLVLMVVGLGAIYAAEQVGARYTPGAAKKQLIFGIIALGILCAVQIPSYQRIGRYAYFGFAAALVLLVVVLFFQDRRGSHRWIPMPGFSVQPSELAKVAHILALAAYLRYRENYRRFVGLLGPFVLTLVPIGLILLEPDLGTSLLLLPVLFVMLFVAGARIRHLLTIIICGIVIAPPLFIVMTSGRRQYQRTRLISLFLQSSRVQDWLNTRDSPATRRTLGAVNAVLGSENITEALDRRDGCCLRKLVYPKIVIAKWASDEGFQLIASKNALGSGRLTGHGLAAEAYVKTLPDSHNDFVFAIIGHQWGFVGCVLVLGAYFLIILCAIETSTLTNDPFGRLLAIGVGTLIAAQVIINVGMTIGVMPITGMTLPFVSYGGSSLLANAIAVGLLLNVAARRPLLLTKKPFEFAEDSRT